MGYTSAFLFFSLVPRQVSACRKASALIPEK
ncbi:hypothetical protein QA052_gp54 [Salmonella phage MET_P1_001_43]|uniref:Uncharacterized protein n=1 Tax=Salmonella phage MET_P1_001_43 TaxID=2982923 RepID=A0A9E8RU47_9CAUD|nr:hypothetical protein QA052_gp54 [Salmonella phage MET_P1_001_43]UZZ64640.1 hypothetical protein [Salmonella phage MET_P1_001_43]